MTRFAPVRFVAPAAGRMRPARFGGGAGVPWEILLRASDWNGSALVGRGATLAPVSGTTPPVLSGGVLTFSGASRLFGAVSVDLAGKAVILIANATATTGTTQAAFSFAGPSAAYAELGAKTVGQFNARFRSAGFGLPTSIDPAGPQNESPNSLGGAVDVFVAILSGSDCVVIVNRSAAKRVARSGGSAVVSGLTLGADRLGTMIAGLDFAVLGVVPADNLSVVQAAVDAAVAMAGGAGVGPIVTSQIDGYLMAHGDSNTVGNSPNLTVTTPWAEGIARAFLIDFSLTLGARADAQMAAHLETDPDKIAKSFEMITATTDYSAVTAISVGYGVNDWRRDVPIAVFNAAIDAGLANLAARAPGRAVVCFLPPYSRGETVANAVGLTLADYRAAAAAKFSAAGAGVVDLSLAGIDAGNEAALVNPDGLHFTQAGHAVLAEYAVAQLRSIGWPVPT